MQRKSEGTIRIRSVPAFAGTSGREVGGERVRFLPSTARVVAVRPDQPPRHEIAQGGGRGAEERERQRGAGNLPKRRAGRFPKMKCKDLKQRRERSDAGPISRGSGWAPGPCPVSRCVKGWKHSYSAALTCAGARFCENRGRRRATHINCHPPPRISAGAVPSARNCCTGASRRAARFGKFALRVQRGAAPAAGPTSRGPRRRVV